MYGLPQAGAFANKLLTKRLETPSYYQCKTPGIWQHKWRPIMFTLVVDDFGVQYTGCQHAKHLITSLEEHYELTKIWQGTKYCGLDLEWDYEARKVRISMKGYIEKNAAAFQTLNAKNQPRFSTQAHGTGIRAESSICQERK